MPELFAGHSENGKIDFTRVADNLQARKQHLRRYNKCHTAEELTFAGNFGAHPVKAQEGVMKKDIWYKMWRL